MTVADTLMILALVFAEEFGVCWECSCTGLCLQMVELQSQWTLTMLHLEQLSHTRSHFMQTFSTRERFHP